MQRAKNGEATTRLSTAKGATTTIANHVMLVVVVVTSAGIGDAENVAQHARDAKRHSVPEVVEKYVVDVKTPTVRHA